MKLYRITTKDNPHDVFDAYLDWMAYDHQMGYNTAELLARIARTSNELSDEENQKEIERAIDIIIAMHPLVSSEEGSEDDDSDSLNQIEYVKVVKEIPD